MSNLADHPKVRVGGRMAAPRTILALMLREMATTYGRSPGGYIWAVLEPAAGIAILSVIFSILGFRIPPLGTNFAIFYATGLIPFLMFNGISQKVSLSILFSRQLLAYPSVTYTDALLARFILNTLTYILVAYVIFTTILVLFETRTTLELDLIIQSLCMTAVLALGVGTFNCFMISMFPAWQQLWSIATRPLFLLSCIFYVFESIPEFYRDILWWNPLVHVVGVMRSAFYSSYDAAYASYIYVYLVALISLMTGLVFLRRYHRDILNN